MEYADYHVIYVDNRVSQDLDGKLIQNLSPDRSTTENGRKGTSWNDSAPEYLESILGEIEEVRSNLRSLLSVFNGGASCYSLCLIHPWLASFSYQILKSQHLIQTSARKLMCTSTYLYFRQYLHGQNSPARID